MNNQQICAVMRRCTLLLAVFCGLAISATVAQAQSVNAQWRVIDRTVLVATGEPARVDNPACANGMPTTAQTVREQIYTAIDTSIGSPVLQVTTTSTPAARHWLNERFSHYDGRSACAAMCGIVPTGVKVKVCEEDAQFGRACFAAGDAGDGPHPYSHTGLMTRAKSESGRAQIVCVNVKHWSDTLKRTFTLEADF